MTTFIAEANRKQEELQQDFFTLSITYKCTK